MSLWKSSETPKGVGIIKTKQEVCLGGGLVREGVLNDNNKERYLKAFKILLEYFKSVKD